MFKFICLSAEILPQFMKLATGFGQRSSSVDEHFLGSYTRVSRGKEETSLLNAYGIAPYFSPPIIVN
jgi:hypothetical protein